MKDFSFRLRAVSPEKLRYRAAVAAMAILYIYLGFHALSGSQGLVSWMEFENRSDRLTENLAAKQALRARLQGEVDRLSATAMDLDTLDIEARRTLFVSTSDEITIWLDPTQP